MHPEGELGSVQGAIRHGVPFVLSSNGTVSIEELTAVPGARCWFQLYVQGDRGFTRDSIARVEAAGCEAVCVTVDTPVLGLRPRQLRAGFSIPADVPLPHAAARACRVRPGTHSAVTWRDVDWLRSAVKSKLLLKGILHPADAELAIQAGVDGIMVSNHGGRNLDTVIPSIEALPDIAEQVAGRVPLLVDGGIRRGTDALKALLRGANAVLIGRPYLYALAVGGADGVARCLSLLIEELRLALALVGAASLRELNRDVEWPPPKVNCPAARGRAKLRLNWRFPLGLARPRHPKNSRPDCLIISAPESRYLSVNCPLQPPPLHPPPLHHSNADTPTRFPRSPRPQDSTPPAGASCPRAC